MKKRTRVALVTIAAILMLMVVSSIIYVSDYYRASDRAASYAVSNDSYTVEKNGNALFFIPAEEVKAGFIFYPGAKVEYTAYAETAAKLAQNGIVSVLIHMPGNLAILNTRAADKVDKGRFGNIDWYIGGHSLGGAMAASYVGKTDEYTGLILFAAYATNDLSDSGLKVLCLRADKDEVLNSKKYEECKDHLPAGWNELVIKGGCHAYFGDYGAQKGDGSPTITQQEQLGEVVSKVIDFINN